MDPKETLPFDPHASACYMSPERIYATYGNLSQDGTKIRYRLSPELADGVSFSTVTGEQEVQEAIDLWFRESAGQIGDSFSVERIAMTDAEFAALPEL